jgi:UDP-glucose:(heptosyl)LPS alpha-1,3-glucosyltransferase
MRIGLMSRRFDPAGGGTERDLLITARILAAAGHQVTIYAADVRASSPEFMVRGLPALPPGRALRLLAFSTRAAATARREGAELVLSFARTMNADILRSGGSAHSSYMRAARRWQTGAEAIAMRCSPYHRLQAWIERRGYASARLQRVIAVSELVRRDLIETFALEPAMVATLYNGVDLERFKPQSDTRSRLEIRDELGIPRSAAVAIFVGNGFSRKGLRLLIEAWPALAADTYLIVVGTDRKAASYARLAARLGVGERILFLSARQDIERLFAAADALALPSLFEPFGNVVIEAMAAGLPALCTTLSGVSEIMPAEMRSSVVADPTNIAELAARLQSMLGLSPSLREVARGTAEKFTWQRYGEELLALIGSV